MTPVLAPRAEKPAAIARPSEWRVVGVRSHGATLELLVAPRTLDALKPDVQP